MLGVCSAAVRPSIGIGLEGISRSVVSFGLWPGDGPHLVVFGLLDLLQCPMEADSFCSGVRGAIAIVLSGIGNQYI